MTGNPADKTSRPGSGESKLATYGAFAGGIFGSLLWAMIQSAVVGDWLLFAAVIVIAVGSYVVATQLCIRRGISSRRVAFWLIVEVAAVSLFIVNWKWQDWVVKPGKDAGMSLLSVNLSIIGVFGTMAFTMFLTSRAQKS